MPTKQARLLREFDLDAPELEKSARQAFRLRTRYITANLERYFQPLPNETGVWKVLVEVVEKPESSGPKNLLGVLIVQVQGEPDALLKGPAEVRERLALDWLSTGVRSVFESAQWPLDLFEAAVRKVAQLGFKNSWEWKVSFSPQRTASVAVWLEMTAEKLSAVAVFSKQGCECGRHTLFECEPNEFLFTRRLGKIHWLDESTVALVSKDGDERWLARC